MLSESFSCNDIWTEQMPSESCATQPTNDIDSKLAASIRHKSSVKITKTKTENHKTVIYFGDSISSKKQHDLLQQQMKAHQMSANQANCNDSMDESSDSKHAQRLCDEMVFKRQKIVRLQAKNNEPHTKCAIDGVVTIVNDVKVIKNESMNLKKHLKTVLEDKCQSKNEKMALDENKIDENEKNANDANGVNGCNDANTYKMDIAKKLPSFVESVVNGVINIKIDDSYDAATKLVRSIESPETEDADSFGTMDDGNDLFLDVGGEVNNIYFDWSFVQDWRSR